MILSRFSLSYIATASPSAGTYQGGTIQSFKFGDSDTVPVSAFKNPKAAFLYLENASASLTVLEASTKLKYYYPCGMRIGFGGQQKDYYPNIFVNGAGLGTNIVSSSYVHIPANVDFQGQVRVLNLPTVDDNSMGASILFDGCNTKSFLAADTLTWLASLQFSIRTQ